MMKIQKRNAYSKAKIILFSVLFIVLAFTISSKKVSAAEDDVVYIPDANLKALLNEKLDVDDLTADITEGQLALINSLFIEFSDNKIINDFTGISYCINLKHLYIHGSPKAVIKENFDEELGKLTRITDFSIESVQGVDYSFIENWSELREIDIYSCDIKALPDLSKCRWLETLKITYCGQLADILSVSKLKYLEKVVLRNCESLTDISPLEGIKRIKFLELSNQAITENNKNAYMKTIASLVDLEQLYVDFCDITDEHTSLFDSLTKLKVLNLRGNKISDIKF